MTYNTDHFYFENQNAAQSNQNAAEIKQDLAIISALGLTPMVDGNQWFFLWGSDLQNGISGFGDTVALAVADFNKQYFTLTNSPKKAQEPTQ